MDYTPHVFIFGPSSTDKESAFALYHIALDAEHSSTSVSNVELSQSFCSGIVLSWWGNLPEELASSLERFSNYRVVIN